MSAYIAIDGGGTKTEFVLFTEEGRILRHALFGGTNVNIYGKDAAMENIKSGLGALLCESLPDGVFAGVAGASTPGNSEIISGAITSCVGNIPVYINSDILNVIHSVPSVDKCISVICGTGCSVFAWDGTKLARYGGWGYRFDRAGGGYDIGCDVLRECFAYDDGFGSPSLVTRLAEEKLGGRAMDRLNDFYAGGPEVVASLAPYAFMAYKEGDATAKEIIYRNLGRVASLVEAADKHSFENKNEVVIISGGLTREKEIITDVLRELLGDKYRLIFPDLPQIYGAAAATLNFCRENGHTDMDLFYKNFAQDYNKIRKEMSSK